MHSNETKNENPTRVALFIDSPDPGGAESMLIQLAMRLPDFEYNPLVLTAGNAWLENQCGKLSIECKVIPKLSYYRSIWSLPLFCMAFRRFLIEENVEILHSHLPGAIFGGAVSCMFSGIIHIGTVHDAYSLKGFRSRVTLLVAGLLGTRFVVVSNEMNHMLQRVFGLFKQFIYLIRIWNGVPLADRQCPRDKEFGEPVTLVCVARLVPLKGHRILLGAIRKIADSQHKFQLLVVGDGPLKSELEEQSTQLKITDKVQFLGHRDDIDNILCSSDIFVNTSFTEGLSVSIAEAMAIGLPVIASNVGGNSELVIDGCTGYTVTPGDTEGFAQRLSALILDEKLRHKFGDAGYEHVSRCFSIDGMLTQYTKLYDHVRTI